MTFDGEEAIDAVITFAWCEMLLQHMQKGSIVHNRVKARLDNEKYTVEHWEYMENKSAGAKKSPLFTIRTSLKALTYTDRMINVTFGRK
jgi:hypothetical protein